MRGRILKAMTLAAMLALLTTGAASPVVAAQTLTQGCSPNGNLSGGFRAGHWVP